MASQKQKLRHFGRAARSQRVNTSQRLAQASSPVNPTTYSTRNAILTGNGKSVQALTVGSPKVGESVAVQAGGIWWAVR